MALYSIFQRCINLTSVDFMADSTGIDVRLRSGKTFILSYWLDSRISVTSPFKEGASTNCPKSENH